MKYCLRIFYTLFVGADSSEFALFCWGMPAPLLTHTSAWGLEINNFSFSSFLPDSFLYFASENQKLINV